jgi:hypothetical protein
MAIELSNLTFTEQDDIVPLFGVEEIVNTGMANTLAGNDVIIGTSTNDYAFENMGTLNTDGSLGLTVIFLSNQKNKLIRALENC